jgi:hypothetical protein
MNNFFSFLVNRTATKQAVPAIILILLCSISYSQSCLPEGIEFVNQSQIDSFQFHYPGCTRIEGDVYIGYFSGCYDITNLNGLNVLASIDGNLRLRKCHSLNDLTGLDKLTMIGGDLIIDENNTLDSLSGLDNLTYIYGDLEIKENITLDKMKGLQNLDSIGGNLRIQDNNHILDMKGLESLKSLGGDLLLYSNPKLIDLTGLDNLTSIGGTLGIWGNEDLENLDAMQNLSYVGYGLEVVNNDLLYSLSGLENISSIHGDMRISHNELLSSCEIQSICEYLSDPQGTVEIYLNSSGCMTAPEIADACGFQMSCLPYGNYIFYQQEDIDNFSANYQECAELEGDVSIREDDITDLSGLHPITTVNGEFTIYSTANLITLEGLENLQSVYGNLRLSHNYRLRTTKGLNALQYVDGSLDLYWNDSLENLEGLENLTAVKALFIEDNILVTSLSELSGLESVGTLYIEDMDGLTDLSGLENLNFVSQNLQIQSNAYLNNIDALQNINVDSLDLLIVTGNELLSECDVKSVCEYLDIPESNTYISSNAPGCNTREEIEIACDSSTCLPFGIVFSTQAQVDSFPINYPYCTAIQGNVVIQGEDITNIDSLILVSHIGGDLTIKKNDLLISISGLENINSIDSNLYIWLNSSLDDLSSFYKLNSIGGKLSIVSNDILPSLKGLDSIDPGSIERLEIFDNHFLSECEVHSVCEYLRTLNSIVLISDNASGCLNETEVEAACESFSIDEQALRNRISIYPNPAFNALNIETNGSTIDEVVITSITGQKVIHLKGNKESIDISQLQAGIYIVEILIENSRYRRKMVIRD